MTPNPHPGHTFLEKMFCREKHSVAARALSSPHMSKDSSVTVASSTPLMIGMSDRYTWEEQCRDTTPRTCRAPGQPRETLLPVGLGVP